MSSVNFDATEVYQLALDLSGVPREKRNEVKVATRKAILDVERGGKAGAPVRTGFLKSSIGHSDLRSMGSGDEFSAEAGPTATYGGFVEYGTSKMAPRPYMGPAFDRVVPGYVEAIEQLGGDIL